MSYHIYTTDCIVLKNTLVREADVFVSVLTSDFGLVRAAAKGVRLPQSKLRGGLADYSVGKISLVRGKDGWRVTDIVPEASLVDFSSGDRNISVFAAKIFSLIQSLCPGEERNVALFGIVSSAFNFIRQNRESDFSLENLEVVLVLRLLRNLGYLKNIGMLEKFLANMEWSRELIEEMNRARAVAILEINSALLESQLVE